MPIDPASLEPLVDYLNRSRGFDFSGYKRASVERRIFKRMQAVEHATIAEYVDYLEAHPKELDALFDTLLISPTSFFRDKSAWQHLAADVLPDLLARRGDDQPLRIWSAGCASGEEPYTLAMVLSEVLGAEGFARRVKIYATDVDENALARARQASYSEREAADVPAELRAKYFDVVDGRYVVREALRRIVLGRHDLLTDAAISRIDLLMCRNTVMYFDADAQARVLARFRFALNDGGVLFLGRAETLATRSDAFAPLDPAFRLSIKLPAPDGGNHDRLVQMAIDERRARAHNPALNRPHELLIEASPMAQIIVTAAGKLAMANAAVREQFEIAPADVGRPLQDLQISYRPVELRAHLDRAFAERRPSIVRDVAWETRGGQTRYFDVHVTPIGDSHRRPPVGFVVAFADVTDARFLQQELDHAKHESVTAYEELQSTTEELHTTNEELQSAVEELETTNEEHQSSNEEHQAINAELQAGNEDLLTVNEAMRRRTDDVSEVNTFLESVLASLRGAVAVVDSDLMVLSWNRGAEELWGLREREVHGKHLLGLDIGLPIERLKNRLRACLGGKATGMSTSLPAVDRRGRPISCLVALTALRTTDGVIQGVILLMEALPAGPAKPDALLRPVR